MPDNYPQNWPIIAFEAKRKAGHKCGACLASSLTNESVKLTVCPIDGNPSHTDDSNLIVLCQLCLLRLHNINLWQKKRHLDFLNAIARGQLSFKLPLELEPQPFKSKLDMLIKLAKSDITE